MLRDIEESLGEGVNQGSLNMCSPQERPSFHYKAKVSITTLSTAKIGTLTSSPQSAALFTTSNH